MAMLVIARGYLSINATRDLEVAIQIKQLSVHNGYAYHPDRLEMKHGNRKVALFILVGGASPYVPIFYTGWWCNNHLEKYELINGKDDILYMKWNIKFMCETTNQCLTMV